MSREVHRGWTENFLKGGRTRDLGDGNPPVEPGNKTPVGGLVDEAKYEIGVQSYNFTISVQHFPVRNLRLNIEQSLESIFRTYTQ